MNTDVNWLDKVLDWGWGVLIAVVAGVAYMVRQINHHGARLDALEKGQGSSLEEIKALEKKIDEKHDRVLEAVNALRTEFREDNRMLTQQLIERVPRA